MNKRIPKPSSTLVELLRWRALHQPERPAYTFLTDEEQKEVHLTYGELDRRARAIAVLLQSLGTTGARALLLHPPGLGLDYIAALFGCLYAKVIAIPAYPIHPTQSNRTLTLPRLQAIAKDAGATLALTTQDTLSSMEFLISSQQEPRAQELASLRWIATDDMEDGLEDGWKEPSITSETLAYLQYTSGSTRMPKGVMVSHGNVMHNSAVIQERWQIPSDGEMVSWLPLHHDLGLVGGVLLPFCEGFHSTLMSPFSFVKWPPRWLRAISRIKDKPVASCAPNFAYQLCVRTITSKQRETLELSNWCVALNAAEPVHSETLKRFTKTFEPCGFRWEAFWSAYGLAEATLIVSGGQKTEPPIIHEVNKAALANNRVVNAGNDDEGACIVGCGQTVLDQTVAIVDPASLTRCPPDQIGEIWVSGPSVAQGYWNRAEETKSTFQAHLADTEEGPFLRTGDLGYLRNGELFITGRLKDLIIIRGGNHYPQDIEFTVEESHEVLRPGGVAAFSVDVEGEERLVVIQEVNPRKDLDLDAVTGAIRQAVAEVHELQVYAVVLIKPRTIPKTSSGKIQRRACQKAFIEGHLEVVKEWRATLPHEKRTEKTFSNKTLENPREASDRDELAKSPNSGTIETWLVSHLAEMLGVNRSEIDRRQPFASFGLDSAQTVSLIGELEAWLGRSLSPTLAWEFPTIKVLAEHLAGETTTPTPVYTIDAPRRLHPEPIAIIGLGCRFPGAGDPEAFWRLLRDGVEAITEVPRDRWDVNAFYDLNPATPGKMNTRWGGFLEQVDLFDPHFFGISPREAASMDPQQRLVLEVSWEALENAGQSVEKLTGSQTGVFIGISTDDYSQLQSGDPVAIDAYRETGTALSIAANRLSYLLDLRGPSLAVDTACSSSLVAVHYACQNLRNRECNLALAGGVNLILSPELTITFSQARMMASDGRCKTFDAEADGYVRGEGCGIVVLKRLSDALKQGDTILAVVRGSAVNQDGRSNGLTAPSGTAQQAVIRQALDNAGVPPNQICYVETHGTGTPLGDPIEFRALAAVLGEGRAPDQPCVLGSVKTNIGHLEAAAGIAGLIKGVLVLQKEEIPPHLHLKKTNPHLPLENTPFVIATERRSLPQGTKPRFVGVSSFGFGGTNAHVVLEEAPISEPAPGEVERSLHLLTLSGKTEEALKQVAVRYADYLAANPSVALADVCFSANTGRSHFNHRLSVVAGWVTQARRQLRAFIAGQEPTGVFKGQVLSTHKPKLAFLFTGQGSQYVGMGRQLYETQPSFRRVLDRCDEILRPYLERSLVEVLYPKSGETSPLLDETAYTQPALFALEYALAQLWRSWGIEPSVVVGHSVGEYVAACVAGVFSLEEGLKLIAKRGRLMQNLPEEGEMVVVFADEAQVAAAIQPYAREVSIAALNGPQNTVISGRREAVEAVVAALHADKVKTRKLAVSHAFHSALMEPMRVAFEQVASEVSYLPPQIGLISNVTGELVTPAEIMTPEYWCRHIRQPVRFAAGMESIRQLGIEVFLEIGPKPILLEMGQHCLPEGAGVWLPSLRPGQSDWQPILWSLGELYRRGVQVNWLGFDQDYARRWIALPTYPWQRSRYWIDVSESAYKTIAPSLTAARSRSIHPLLGQRLHLAGTQEIRFESKISWDSPAFLTQYRVYETAIVPATAYLEMALAAAAEAFGPSFHIVAALEFQRALFLPGGASPTLQLSLSADETGGASFSIHSRLANTTKPSQAWTLHAIGKVVEAGEENAADNLEPSSPEATQARCPQVVAGPDFYRQLRERGFQPGPSFEGIDQLWRGEGEALGRVSLPQTLEAQVQDYQFHPALLDACLQVLEAAASVDATENGRGGLYVPIRMGQVRLSARPSRGLWSYARLRTESDKTAGTLEGDVLVFDDAGQMVAEVHCLRLQRLDREVGHLTQVNVSDWLYELQWHPKSHLGQVLAQLSPDYLLPLPQIADRVQSRVMQLSARHGLQQYLELKPRLDSLSVAYVVKAFRQLGWKFGLNERVLINNLAEQWGVVDKHRRLLGRMFEMLESDGVLTKVDGDWWISRVPEITDPQETWHALLAQFPACKAELTLISQCGLRLADVLRGNVDPLTLLFPEGSMALVEALYKDSPFTCIYNRLIQETISTALERLPEGRTVRILEIGAGTGATTSYLLPRLSANRTEYVFTDLSNLFTTTAEHKFRDYPFVRYALLDVEQDIEAQGFAPHQFDVILAANVLHATSDLRYTLSNVRRLLTSQGMLILLEATSDQPWLDLIFGLTEGWWKFADLDLRPSHPLLSRRKWFNLLAKQGFTQLASLPMTKPESGCELEQIVILARGPRVEHKPRLAETITRPTEPRATWLIFADREGVGQALGEIIRSRNEHSILVSPSKVYSRAERNHYHIRPERPEDIRQLLAEALGPNDLPFRGIIHLWSLDAASTDEITATSLEAEQTLVCGSVLHLVQALADGGSWANAYPRLWLVTRGAQSVGTWANIAVVQAPLWGLGRVLRQEHPELWGGLVDLDPECSAQDASCLLWGELKCPDGEDQIAYRLGQRYVARLIRLCEAAGQTRPLKWQRNGSYLITGGLGNLGLLVARWMVEQGARRLILIGRTKLPPRTDWHQIEADSRMAHQIVAIRELEALGASVHIASVDVADEAQLIAFLDGYRRESWPPIVGVVHLAAVLRDGMVAQTDVAALNAVFRPKSTGAWHLHRLFEDASLDFFVLFSSAASLLGQPGHGSYAAANAFLDALAYYRRVHGLPVLSINWGVWANIGFATTPGGQRLARHLALMGIESIPLRQGLEMLEQLLRQGMTQAAVLPVNWAQYRQFYPAAGEPPLFSYLKHERDDELSRADSQTEEVKQVSEQQHELLQRLKKATARDRKELLAAYVQDRITKILGLDSSIQLAGEQSLGELGFDSLMGTQLKNRFMSELGVDVPIKEFIGRVSIAQLIGLLLDHLILSSLARSEPPSSDISEDKEEIAV